MPQLALPTPAPMAHGNGIIHEGWVLKKRRKKMQGFARRYFVLHSSGLLSYSFGPGKPARDEILLSRAAVSTAIGRKDIHVDSSTATFHIKCLTMDDFNVWMAAIRRFVVNYAQRSSSVRSPKLTSWSLNKSMSIVEEIGLTISELEDSISALQSEITSKKQRGSSNPRPEKDKTKEHVTIFGLFKKSGNNANRELAGDDDHDTASARSQISSQQRVQKVLESLKSQHANLLKSLYMFSSPDANLTSALPSGLPSTTEEEDAQPTVRVHSPIARRSLRSSTMASSAETVNEWFDALDMLNDNAQEFVMDSQASPEELDFEEKFLDRDSASSAEPLESGGETDFEEEEEVAALVKVQSAWSSERALQVTRRTQLAAPQVSDEGSLFAILKKNVGKDLSSITFPVTFNEPLTLLQRLAEEMEYHDLLRQAAETSDPLNRFCYVAAFAVSQYTHSRLRTGRKGFNPMLGETFEDTRMLFIAEKVQHQPLVLAFHAEGEGWELYGTSSGKTKFWGKSLEIMPLGTTHLKIGNDLFEWKKPSSFVRNLMMGSKYLEHCGKLTIENKTSNAQCILDFKQSGYWVASNTVTGTVHSRSGDIMAELEGNWDEQLAQKLDSSKFRVLWRANPFPRNANEYYGLTSFGITLNEITSDLVGVLSPTDSRYRPDVRALEEGDLDRAEAEKTRIEEMQRERRRQNAGQKPRWFTQFGEDWVYMGGYWEQRARGWKGYGCRYTRNSNWRCPGLSSMRAHLFAFLAVLPLVVVSQVNSPRWAAAYAKARSTVAKLNLTEKVNLVTGQGFFVGNCTGSTPPIPSFNFSGLCLQDSALGVRGVDLISVFPAGINTAATFNRTLMHQRGIAMGKEFRGKGVNVQLGPMMNLVRAPAAGRNWEGLGTGR